MILLLLLLLTFENLLLLVLRDIGTEEETRWNTHLFVDWHFYFTKILAGNPGFERRNSRDKNAFLGGFWLERKSVEIGAKLSSKEGRETFVPCPTYRGYFCSVTNNSIFEYCIRREIGSFFAGKREKGKEFLKGHASCIEIRK